MRKITLWNKTFQSLILSNEESSQILAFALSSNTLDIVHWWYLGRDNVRDYQLPYLSVSDSISIYNRMSRNNLIPKSAGGLASVIYIKSLYENYLNSLE